MSKPEQGEPAAYVLERARRGASVRRIAGTFAILSVLVAPLGFLYGPPGFVMELVAAVGYGAIWRRARSPRHPERAGLAIVGILLAQMVYTSVLAKSTMDEVHLAYFVSVVPFIAGVTMAPRGVMLTGAVVAVRLATQAALHAGPPTFTGYLPFLPPATFFLMSWSAALAASMASRRALDAHVRDEASAHAAREAAHEAEERHQIVSDRMSDLVSVFDRDGTCLYASASHERVLGIRAEDLVGRQAPELIHPDDLDQCVEAFDRARREGSSFFVTRLRVAGGGVRWFHLRFSTVVVRGVPGIAASARDITEERALTEELASTRRMEALGRLAGGVAHDFNNLLLVIESCTDLAGARLPADHPAHKELADVHGAAERAAAITQQLLTFARRQVLPKAETSAVGEVFRELAPILARIVGPNVALDVDVKDAATTVDATPVQLEQLVMNLASNARDAMAEGGTLTITVRDRTVADDESAGVPPGRYAEIEVTDTGAGMTEELQSQIFEPFFTTKPAGRGTGLGLATVFGLVSQLGGRISVRSAPGAGSTFTVLLPATRGLRAPEGVPAVEAATAAGAAPPLRILVVDDEAEVRALITRVLQGAGHRPTEAASVEEALAKAEQPGARFDAIVTDVVVGSGDAIAMLDRVTAAQPGAGIVVISGFTPSSDRLAKVRERGAQFLAKPFGSSNLLEALARARAALAPEPPTAEPPR